MKYLTLIRAVALLHQHQRQIKRTTRRAKTLEYIEATPGDDRHRQSPAELVGQLWCRSLDELRPETRRMLLLIDDMVTAQCQQLKVDRGDFRFTPAVTCAIIRAGAPRRSTHPHGPLAGDGISAGASWWPGPELRLRAHLRDGRRAAGRSCRAELRRTGGPEATVWVCGGGVWAARGSGLGRVWARSGGCLGVAQRANPQYP